MKREKTRKGDVMKNNIQLFITLVSLIVTTQTSAISNPPEPSVSHSGLEKIQTHNTITSVALRMQLNDDLYGTIESKVCSFCKTLKIKITPQTTAYDNDVKVPLKEARNRIGRNATIIYELKTNIVSAIRW